MMSTNTTPKLLGHEYIQTDEDAIAAKMVDELEAQVTRMYEDKKMLRQIHTKMHGCVKAEFIVEPDLPENLKVGIFCEAKTYISPEYRITIYLLYFVTRFVINIFIPC